MRSTYAYAGVGGMACTLGVVVVLALAGCSSSGIVGQWTGEDRGVACAFTFFSDGTGDVTAIGKTRPLKWKRVNDKCEVFVSDTTAVATATLREDGSLVLQAPDSKGLGLLILKRK